jgi:hypothetical protein
MSNYRPISLLTQYVKPLLTEKFEFQKGMSIENAAFKLTDKLTN